MKTINNKLKIFYLHIIHKQTMKLNEIVEY